MVVWPHPSLPIVLLTCAASRGWRASLLNAPIRFSAAHSEALAEPQCVFCTCSYMLYMLDVVPKSVWRGEVNVCEVCRAHIWKCKR